MPSVSEKQRRFFGAELGRAKSGKKTRTGLSIEKLKEFARSRSKKKKKRPSTGSLIRELARRRS